MAYRPFLATLGSSLAITALMVATPARADDRKPDAQETQAIAAVLEAAGYTSWEEIEFDKDDNRWEVDDARDRQGGKWDLHLAPDNYEIIHRERD